MKYGLIINFNNTIAIDMKNLFARNKPKLKYSMHAEKIKKVFGINPGSSKTKTCENSESS